MKKVFVKLTALAFVMSVALMGCAPKEEGAPAENAPAANAAPAAAAPAAPAAQ